MEMVVEYTRHAKNQQVGEALHLLGRLTQLAGESPFKQRAYNAAADRIEHLDTDISTIADPSILPGIGDSIADKILAILQTGTCDKLDELKAKYGSMLPILDIPGIGPKTAQKLFRMGIQGIGQLKAAVESGKITDRRIVESVKAGLDKHQRIPLAQAEAIATEICGRIVEHMGEDEFQMSVAGSLRRQRPTIGDIDIIISTLTYWRAVEAARNSLDVVIEEGTSKVSGISNGVHVDIRITAPDAYGAMLLYFTGSTNWNILMRRAAIRRGWTLNEYGLWDGEVCIASGTEQEIMAALDWKWTEPDERDIEI
jgi:DNA polymerase (family 10)